MASGDIKTDNLRLAIIDSGGANIASLRYAIERLGVPSELTTDPRFCTAELRGRWCSSRANW
jgi:hypothetical protein